MSWGTRVIKDDLTPTLMKLQNNMQGVKLRLSMMKVVEDMVDSAKSFASVRSGYLRSSIQARMDKELQIIFEATAHYAVFVEFGTWKMSPQPFMRPAVEKHEADLYREIGKALFS